MNNRRIFLQDPLFNLSGARDCNLLISITPDAFSYAVTSNGDNRLKALCDVQDVRNIKETIEQAFIEDLFLSADYHSVKVSCSGKNEVLVPNELADQEPARWLPNADGTDIYLNESEGCTPIFQMPAEIQAMIDQTNLKDAKKFHPLLPMLKITQGDGLYLSFSARAFYAVYMESQAPVFQNRFEISQTDELNYYLINILNTLKVNTAEVPVHVCGIINENDDRHNCLKKYFPLISFLKAGRSEDDNALLDNYPLHYFSPLLALDTCE